MAKEKQEKHVVVEQKHTKKMEQPEDRTAEARVMEQDLLHLEKEILLQKAAHAQDRDMGKLEREKQPSERQEKADGATKVFDEVKANERIAKNLETEVGLQAGGSQTAQTIYQLRKTAKSMVLRRATARCICRRSRMPS